MEIDEELAFACRAIDWGVGPLVVPKRYRPLLERAVLAGASQTAIDRGEIMMHDTKLMSRALGVGLIIDAKTEPGGLIYRYCFDKLFAHLVNIHRLLLAKQVEANDLHWFRYWLIRIAVYEYPPASRQGNEIFQPFLEHEPFGYRGVIDLGKALDVPGWVRSWEPSTVSW